MEYSFTHLSSHPPPPPVGAASISRFFYLLSELISIVRTRRSAPRPALFFSRQVKLVNGFLAVLARPMMHSTFRGLHLYLLNLSACFTPFSTSLATSGGISFSSFSALRQRDSSAEMWVRC